MTNRTGLLFVGAFVLVAAPALAKAPDPVGIEGPADGSLFVLGRGPVEIRVSRYDNAKKFECTFTQGAAKWRSGPQKYGLCKMTVEDQARFKPGPVNVAVRVFYRNAWLKPATMTISFLEAPHRATVDEQRAARQKELDQLLKDANAETVSNCDCNVPITVDYASFPDAEQMRTLKDAITAVSLVFKNACEDPKRKQGFCARAKSGRISFEPNEHPASSGYSNGVALCTANRMGYCSNERIMRAAEYFGVAAPQG
jgi:hypothetical protein